MPLNDTDLFKLVLQIDTQLIEKGVPPHARPFQAIAIAESLGAGVILGSEFFAKIDAIYKKLYRHSDLVLPPMHMGAFMFRDVFFPLRISVLYGGARAINPIDLLLDATDFQKKWLFDNKETGLSLFDQVIDLIDFTYGLDDFEKVSSSERTKELWFLAKRQLEAGAAAILGSFDGYAVIQNSCIATELLLKGALSEKTGMTDKQLKAKYGHEINNLCSEVASVLTEADGERLLSVVQKLPHYTNSRYYDIQDPQSPYYDAKAFSQQKVGELLMNTQFIAGEILRQFSDRDTRSTLTTNAGSNSDWDFTQRVFPSEP